MSGVNHPRIAVLALLAVAAAWGSTFFLTKDLLTRMDVADYLALRFLIASVALILVHPPAISRLSRLDRGRAVALGHHLRHRAAGPDRGPAAHLGQRVGFVTGMYVVFTPLLAAVILRHKIGRWAWVAVILATVGLGVLSLQRPQHGHRRAAHARVGRSLRPAHHRSGRLVHAAERLRPLVPADGRDHRASARSARCPAASRSRAPVETGSASSTWH